MKLIITTPDVIYNKSNKKYFKKIVKTLKYFKKQQEGNDVLFISIHKETLDIVPKAFSTLHIRSDFRRSPRFLEILTSEFDYDFNDIYIFGAKDVDMHLAANSKVLFLNASYSKVNNPKEKIFKEDYGVNISNHKKLKIFFKNFINIEKPWYFSLEITNDTKIFGLTNAMTRKYNNKDFTKIGNELLGFLKQGVKDHKEAFMIYALMSMYEIFKDIQNVNYWGYYPSSSTSSNDELSDIKEMLRKSFKSSTTKEDIFIRHKQSVERKRLTAQKRVKDGCDSQFDSIHINPWFKKKIKGKNVCIIDDFSNHGTSSETIRYLLKHAGVNKIIFIALGKFRTDYNIYNYEIKGDVFTPNGYTYTKKSLKKVSGKINNNSSVEILNSLKELTC